ncbi:hypothetical protein ATANTOWER_020449 [Ataeniobius toweri]|uniref:Uncharacterized protein n=1 Tax=Ataeniobius toweri TaxID=208326 RepID=A0ABU7C3G6_9TELE|nr:hypothetical protein [Ataeniobius toweri]
MVLQIFLSPFKKKQVKTVKYSVNAKDSHKSTLQFAANLNSKHGKSSPGQTKFKCNLLVYMQITMCEGKPTQHPEHNIPIVRHNVAPYICSENEMFCKSFSL